MLYEPYDRLVSFRLMGHNVKAPENNNLLRCFQYVCPDSVPYGRFCWNDECGNCAVAYLAPDQPKERWVRACIVKIEEGMAITQISTHLRFVLSPLLDPPEPVDLQG